MGNKIFVGGLNWDATEDDIREAFGASGTITDITISPFKIDIYTGPKPEKISPAALKSQQISRSLEGGIFSRHYTDVGKVRFGQS